MGAAVLTLDRWITPLLDLGGLVLNAIPERAVYALADVGGALVYRSWPKKRAAAHENYRVALGDAVSIGHLHRTARRSFRTYSRMILDVLRFRRLPLERLRDVIKLEGLEHLEAAHARGKGVVAVTPHLGNWEPASNIIAFLPYRFLAVVDEGVVSRAVASSRQRAGWTVTPASRAARPAMRALRQNNVVLLAADIVKDFRAARVELFGRETHLPAGPAYLAVRTGAALVPVVSVRQTDNTSVITIEPPVFSDPARPPEEEANRLSQVIADYFSAVIRRHPEQWYPYRLLWEDR